jgi:hypothetical protein
MAKKRGGGGAKSNMGLIITLVFFVLATVILGVTTYLGFSEQEAKDKAKAEAIAAEKKREEERNWYRFQVRAIRQYIGAPPAGLDVKDLAREKAQFDKGQLVYANTMPDKAEVAAFFKDKLDKTFPWDAAKDDSPRLTLEKLLLDKQAAYDKLVASAKQVETAKNDAERLLKETREQLEAEKTNFKDNLAKLDIKATDDRKTDRATIDTLRKDLEQKGREKEKETTARAEAQAQLAKVEGEKRGLQGKLATLTRDNKEVRDALDETRSRLEALAQKSNVDLRALEAQALDARAVQMLKSWKKDWQVVNMDRKGTMPYISLGSADGLTPQVTFSVHAVGLDGKLNSNPKGTLEVVRVIGPHLAQARLTSVKDNRADPILKGDRLFNPTWDPNRKRRVALAGIADLGGDGTDNTEDFRRLMKSQNVDLDAYIDTKDDKTPKVVGKGITTQTDYLILGDSLDGANHPRSRDRVYADAYNRQVTAMKAKAAANGVSMISLRKYLDLIGYQAPKVVTSNPTLGGGGRGY